MSARAKSELIREACGEGFRVWSEVGRKDPGDDANLSVDDKLIAIEGDLAAGAETVILEGRESGTVGIYDREGKPAEELLHRIHERFEPDSVLFEAPQKSQQVWLIRSFGALVNLGNVASEDALSVATLRLGLRGDTFADTQLPGLRVHFELGVNGATAARRRGGVVIVVDALRASATIVTALAAGMRAVRPVATVEECRGDVTAGERGGKKIAQAMHGNSPSELLRHDYRGRELVLTTTNGVECILTASGPDCEVLVGTTLNARAVARAAVALCEASGGPLTIVTAGRNQLEAPEDECAAALLLEALGKSIRVQGEHPRVPGTVETVFFESDSGRNLVALGYADDVRFCAQRDIFDLAPILREGRLIPWRG